jgi:hypothetical protein
LSHDVRSSAELAIPEPFQSARWLAPISSSPSANRRLSRA